MRRLYGVLVLLLVVIFACQREVSFIGGPDTLLGEIATPDPITTALQGNVFDETGAPAAGVTVQAGSKIAITDNNGYFRINDAPLDKKSAAVTALKAGYFKAYRSFAATSGANYVNIKLVKKTAAGTVDATAGGDVSLNNGSKLTLPANGVVNAATGAAYSGQIKVYASYIDPTSADIDQIIPGSFMANNKDGKRVLLTSYGMMAVELESASGEKLQIKSGSTAKLTMAIPASAQASAPATIALWYVDETTGIWKEEGTATKNGNVYVGDVKHFTYWNCDLAGPTTTFTAKFQTASGQPLVNVPVNIRPAGTTYGGYAHGFTDSLGQVSGPVPANMSLVLEVVQNGFGQCNAVIYRQNVGPFAEPINFGTVTVSNTSNTIKTIKGKLVDCSNAPVTNGYALISVGYMTFYASVNTTGDFEKSFVYCDSTNTGYSVTGVNAATQQQTVTPSSGPLVQPIIDIGSIMACGTSTAQFFNYTLDGTNFSLTSPGDSLRGHLFGSGASPWNNVLSGNSTADSTHKFSFAFTSTNLVPGTYPVSYLYVNNYDSTVLTTPFNVTITNFPASPAQFYEGNFSGQFRDKTNASHTISATFRLRYQ